MNFYSGCFLLFQRIPFNKFYNNGMCNLKSFQNPVPICSTGEKGEGRQKGQHLLNSIIPYYVSFCLVLVNFSIFETQSHFVAQARLQFVILPSLPYPGIIGDYYVNWLPHLDFTFYQ